MAKRNTLIQIYLSGRFPHIIAPIVMEYYEYDTFMEMLVCEHNFSKSFSNYIEYFGDMAISEFFKTSLFEKFAGTKDGKCLSLYRSLCDDFSYEGSFCGFYGFNNIFEIVSSRKLDYSESVMSCIPGHTFRNLNSFPYKKEP